MRFCFIFSYLVEYMMTSFKQKLASFYFFVNHKKIAKIKSNLNTKFKFSYLADEEFIEFDHMILNLEY